MLYYSLNVRKDTNNSIFRKKTDEKYSSFISFYLINPSTSLWIAFD
ncbi:hypothetical protein HMPREF9442_01317 [Paraprevotella xylaniphila YIT 11841]|uniref:Uncharacterized protein n=1 Tax=Paraprevotella xylaniphila YIT 11841 TaxID=762982 RepID=F3QT01_9BACT|nr:hypothetical protein HMPREF9442_01317 [Paraprevotella xylaniphila YIT 11841]